jgi:S-adenosylmethionine:tRNA ribosyltransferase-isomerase
MSLKTSDFDYPLDESLIAQQPLEPRDSSRLMVLDRQTARVDHHVFGDLPELLRAGDLMVLNDTRVVPARFTCRRATGGRIEGLFIREEPDRSWEVMLRGAGRCNSGERLAVEGAETVLLLEANRGAGTWKARPEPPAEAFELLERVGSTPLPPYIRQGREGPGDRQRYQTVFADKPGAVAAPTAALHFTPRLLDRLAASGVAQARVTLHVGIGTFRPVAAESIAEHSMHREWYELGQETAEAINAAKAEGRRVVAVGTTAVRTLETAARQIGPGQPLRAASGWSDLFLYPPAPFHVVDAMLTNFHLPRSTLLMLVAAFCSPGRREGRETILAAYAEATRQRYRFFSYGDAMLIQ